MSLALPYAMMLGGVARGSALYLVLGCALLGSTTAGEASPGLPAAPARVLSFLHAGPKSGPSSLPQIVDGSGREVLLKGVNVGGLVDYFRGGVLQKRQPIGDKLTPPYSSAVSSYLNGTCVPDVKSVPGVPVCESDFAQMRPLGYDVIRLALSWSLLEPTQNGGISTTYLDRIGQVVAWAKAQGIYVILDLHQDAWSKYDYTTDADRPSCAGPLSAVQGYDGAPQWASRQHRRVPACALLGVREFDSAVQDDFRGLYNSAKINGPIFRHFEGVFVALAQRFHNEPAVAGYEIFNEPSPGFLPTSGAFDQTELLPMDGKVITYVVTHVSQFQQLFFVEPNALRNFIDESVIVTPWKAFSAYPNVVYTPHIYTGVFTLDRPLGQHIFPSNGGYDSSVSDAQHLGLPLFVSEFGNGPGDDSNILRQSYISQDKDQVGGTLWLWKENGEWGVYYGDFGANHDGIARTTRIKYTARAYPIYTAGHLSTFTYDPDALTFDLRATSRPVVVGDHLHATLLFVPAAVQGTVRAENATLEVFNRSDDGSREVYVYPSGGGYHVFVGP
jgi:endoglycosylceramidase